MATGAKKMTPNEIATCQQLLDRIKGLDETIRSIGDAVDGEANEWGEKNRDAFGRNRLSQFTNEHLGQVVAVGIVNALLDEREACAQEISEFVDVADPPCPKQKLPAKAA